MTGRYKTTLWFGLLALAVAAGGCTAFADAVDGGGGGYDGGVELTIDPLFAFQGKKANYTITFSTPPPWKDKVDEDNPCFLTYFELVELENPNHEFSDAFLFPDYCEDDASDPAVIKALIQMQPDADTETLRLLKAVAAFNELGKPQQFWTGTGRFWVLPDNEAQDTDGGTDGDDGGGDEP